MNEHERLLSWVNTWTKSYTGSFTPGNMGQLLYGKPADIAHNLSHGQRYGSLRTNALLEYTQRGEWVEAAQVARALASGSYWVVEEIKTVFGQERAAKLLDAPLGSLPTV